MYNRSLFPAELPMVSIVVPVRNSEGSIRRLTESLLRQDYVNMGGALEIIYIGSIGDTTWAPIRDVIADGRVVAIEADIVADGRDANPKRNIGLRRARGQILALTDSDMEMPDDWVSGGVLRLLQSGHKVVAGPMVSLGSGFWSDYVDHNEIGSKTPRMAKPYVITKETLGKPGYKLPITANVFLCREVFGRVGDLDPQFTQTYDDYVWFRDIVVTGYSILCDPGLAAYHRHREGFKSLMREYWSAGCGCMDYIARHKADAFSRARSRQLATLLYGSIAAVTLLALMPVLTVAMGVAGYVLLAAISILKSEKRSAWVFPAVTFVLGCCFIYGIIYRFFRQSWRGVVLTEIRYHSLLYIHEPQEASS
ncbi:MAG TPA: glycosyltransferase [Candidatus Saccharimonadales bacterium]|nr:glycosyltransferase [Candidatus Saccharimonadales bacterium]